MDFTQRLEWYKSQGHAQNDRQLPKRIQCYAIDRKYLYLDALGDVYPCCYLGAQPRTFDRQGGVMQHVHERVSALMYNNNLFENTGLKNNIVQRKSTYTKCFENKNKVEKPLENFFFR